ncbi:hypothetical protein G6F64_015210 [Rhizopus arrhizus]|uniref:Uncharacterized protein n=1 Tax=Rhizopus oryzae TaxID=64495 RepID=A0A9P6WS18_RHIOR|nr:hypothetical protein G6F64_015210 [Rhizopus arrhizus]
MLAAEAAEHADQLETEVFVQLDRSGVGRFTDHRHHLPVAACHAGVDEGLQQAGAHALALETGIDVDRILDGPLVGHAGAVGVGGKPRSMMSRMRRSISVASGMSYS